MILSLLFVFSTTALATNVSGTISQNTTWTTGGSPYVLTGNVTIASGVTLTVDSGVVVKPQSSSYGLTVNGTLNATGAVFTSYKDDAHGGDTNGDGTATSPAPGNWKYIYFASGGSGALNGCSVLYGGYGANAAVYISGSSPTITGTLVSYSSTSGIYAASGSATITSDTVSNNQGSYGIYLAAQPAALHDNVISGNSNAIAVRTLANLGQGTVYNNSYSGNKQNAMFLFDWVTSSTTWPLSNAPYILINNQGTNVSNNATLTIDPGVIVKFLGGPHGVNGLRINAGSTLNATNVVFTSNYDDAHGGDTNGDGAATSPAPGDWARIYFYGGGGTLSGCSVLYGGYLYGSEVHIDNGSAPAITDSNVSNSKSDGIHIEIQAGSPSITGNTVSDNQGAYGIYSGHLLAALHDNTIINNPNAVAVRTLANMGQGAVYNNSYSGNKQNAIYLYDWVTSSTTWPLSNSPYVLINRLGTSVSNNAVLTIDPGVVVKFDGGPHGVNGLKIDTGGVLNATGAVFTSLYDDAHGGDTNGDGDATVAAPGDWARIYFYGGGGTLSGCTILFGGYLYSAEVYIENSSPTITESSISKSMTDGVYVYSGSPAIHENDIFTNANGYYGLYSRFNFNASNNWWGGVGGPKPYGTGNAVNADKVTASPWSDVPFTQSGTEAEAMGTDTWCGAFGEPVNTSTGAFTYAHTDISIPTRGLPLDFARTYNSNDANDGPLGFGWSYSWQISASVLTNGNVVILRGDGRRDTFIKNPDDSYTAPAGRHDTLTKNQDGTYKLMSKDQISYNFGSNNRLASAVSETGQMTSFTYDANKRLVTITEPSNRTLTFTYNSSNRIDEITDPQSNTVSFTYSTEGNLTQVTDQNGGVTVYAYDGFHHITSITDPNSHAFVNNVYDASGRVSEQRDADDNLITFAYNPANHRTTMTRVMDPNDAAQNQVTVHEFDSQLRITKETDPYGKETTYTYDAAGNPDSVTDRRGVTTRSIFDMFGNVTDVYKAYGLPEQQHTQVAYNSKNHQVSKTDARGYTTGYTYDGSGTYLQQISYPQVTNYDSTASDFTEGFTYNANGTLATSTDRNGDVSSYSYDAYGGLDVVTKNTNRTAADQVSLDYDFDTVGRKTAFTDGNGHETTFEYNPIGDLRYVRTTVTNPETQQLDDVITEFQYDGNGNKTAAVDPEGKTTSYAYTPMDNISVVTDAKLNTVENTYDAAYNRTATKDKNGNWTNFAYDKNNRLVSVTDAEDYTTSYGLDEEGNQISETDPLDRTITKTYDGLGRLSSVTQPDEGNTERTTSFTYDQTDNLITTTDPASHTYTSTFDELGRLRTATDPLSNTVSYRYDGQGGRIKTRDQHGYETSFAYSPNEWLTSVTDPLSNTISYEYDQKGNLTQQADPEGHITLYAYDELNSLSSEKVDAAGGNYLLEKSYIYDRAGHLTKDTTGDGSIGYSYDDTYNLTGVSDRQGSTYSYTYDAGGNQLTATDVGANQTVTFIYNPRDLLANSTDALGAQEAFTYDGAGNLTQRDDSVAGQSFSTTFEHTPRNQLKSVTRGADTSRFTFDPAGNLSAKTYPNGVTTSYAYDEDSRLTSQEAVSGGQTLQSFDQSYDAAGNLATRTENGTITSDYTYDQINRLTSEDIGGYGQIDYSYDGAGNRLTLDSPTTGHTDYAYNQANQLTQMVNGQDTTDLAYDDNGALSQKTQGQDTTTYAYNGLDKLTQVTTPSTTVDYAYDALGRRISRTEGEDTRNSHLSGGSDLENYQTDGAGNLASATLRGADGLISETDYSGTPATTYNLYSPHGDTTAATDSSGAVTQSYSYDAFGNSLTGAAPSNGYTGKWQRDYDEATGTIRMGVREYDPGTGRFASADPLKGSVMYPQQRSRYPYVGNNPLVRYDLNGLYWGESLVDAAVGTWNDYQSGGLDALWNDWKAGFDSMSTGQQVALLGVPVGAGVVAAGVEAAGVGGTVIFGEAATGAIGDELAVEGSELIERGGPECEAASKTVLGKYPDYLKLADDLEAGRFNIAPDIWNRMSTTEQWAANQKFLDGVIQRGDDIILSNPVMNIDSVQGSFRQELEYLFEKGFKLSEDGTRLVRP